jgi:hypothetical protein
MIADGTIVDADINASAAIALSKLATGALPTAITVASANIANDTIVNANINSAAAIVDTKLATIATAGKVSNSATTATSANTLSAIVARDGSGNFTAGTITAALTGAASSNVLKAGDTMTGALVVPLASASTPSLTFTGDLNTGIYSPGADQLAVSTGGTGRLFVNASGRVGIGTSSPVANLHVTSAIPTLVLDETDGTSTHAQSWLLRNENAFQIQTRTNTGVFASLDYSIPSSTSGATNHIWYIAGTERARIDSSGRLLVGTSTAFNLSGGFGLGFYNCSINGAGAFARFTNDANGPEFEFAKSRNAAIGSHTVVNSSDNLGAIKFAGSDGANFRVGAQILCQVDGTPGADDMPGRLVFSTTADGASSPTERLRITSAGVLQIADAGHIAVGTTTGTKIGTATTQKIGFYDATPVVQPTAVADATDAATVITQLNALLTRMRNLGLIAT